MTIRDSLRDAQPHVSMREGFKALIQRSRSLRKQGENTAVKGRSDVDRFLATPAPETFNPSDLKQLLWTLLNAESPEDRDQAARSINAMMAAVNGPPTTGDVSLRINGGPHWLDAKAIDSWIGSQDRHLKLSVRQASALAYHLNGYVIGGEALEVQTSVALPSVNRSDRGRQRSRNTGSWLPFIDEVGQYSLTPKPVAVQHAQFLSAFQLPVFDPFCGLGGDAIAFAEAGLSVHASEIDAGRMSLAKKNAAALGVESEIQFYAGDGVNQLSAWSKNFPEHLLFLDPPWGGTHWDRKNIGIDQLFPRLDLIQAAIENAVAVVLKLPRTFRTVELNTISRQWSFQLGIASNQDHIADRVRLISALSGPN